ncbi:MAG: hypothetical protein HQM06_15920, partial [Magnetococcales bacterium]|nr:hypothetical protein [Magnetococcales bacterium]
TLSGSSAIQIKVSDAAGNDGLIANQSYLLDSTAPAITIVEMRLSNDSGVTGDFITATTAQTILGTLSFHLSYGEYLYGSTDNGTLWTDITDKVVGTTFSWDGVLLSGSNTLLIKVSDTAGNDAPVGSHVYHVDTAPPVVTISNLDLATDTGISASDFVTRTAEQSVTATLSSAMSVGESLYGSLDGGLNWTDISAKVSGVTVNWDGLTLVAGAGTIQLKVMDAAGNSSAIASQLSLLDMTPPTTTLSGIQILTDGGLSNSDFITSTASQTISGTLSDSLLTGEFLYGSLDSGNHWTDVTGKVSGTALVWDNATLLGGSHDIQFKVVDLAGNDGPLASQFY